MGYFRSQDIRLLLFLNNRLHLKGLKAFMRAYTHLGGVAFHSCLAIFLLFAERPLGVTFLINIFVSQFLVHSLKFLVHRPRPYATYESVIVRKESRDTNAFPSAHTASSLMAAFTFSKAFPELAWLFYPLAILVGLSRIILGYHYPSDVLASMLLTSLTYTLLHFLDFSNFSGI